MKKYEVDGKVFTDEDEAIKYCGEEGVDTAKIVVYEDQEEEKTEVIDEEDLVENPDEDSIITTDEEQEEIELFQYLVEHWDEVSEADKRQILSVAFGHETGHKQLFEDKTKLVEGKVDGIAKKDIGKPLGKYHLYKILKTIEYGKCPFCNLHYSQNAFFDGVSLPKELSFFEPSTRPLRGNPPVFEKQAKAKSPKMFTKEAKIKVTIHHIKSKHVKLYKLLYDVFNQFEWVTEPKSVHLQPRSSPHSLSKKRPLENLSEEELSAICEDEELRALLFRTWKKKLEDRS